MTQVPETSLSLKQFGLVRDIWMINDDGERDEDGPWVRVEFDTCAVVILPIPMMETAIFDMTDEMEETWTPRKE